VDTPIDQPSQAPSDDSRLETICSYITQLAEGPDGARNLFIIETFLKNPALMPYARQMMNDGLSLDVVAQALANIQMPLSD